MPPSFNQRRSPSATNQTIRSSSRDANALQIAAFTSLSDIPSTLDLSQLTTALKERSRFLSRRLESVYADENDILADEPGKGDAKRKSLQEIFEQAIAGSGKEDRSSVNRRSVSRSPSIVRRDSSKVQGKSRPISPLPSAIPLQNLSAASPSSHDAQRQRVKVKREADRDQRERSIGATSITSGTGGASPGFEADWDDDTPARPGRTYLNNRKRHRANGLRADSPNDDAASLSELDSPHPNGSRPPFKNEFSSHSRRESIFSTSGIGQSLSSHKLKLNPTAQTAVHKRDSVSGGFLRRASGMRGDEAASLPLTPFQIQQAAMWELPSRTAETFIPKEAQPRYIRPHPIKPDDVDVDFSSMDWRERDKERDRLEAAAAAAASGSTGGPAPGQALVKESAINRARDRKQEQVAFHTFQQWCDGWFRTLTEEDLAWLSSKSEDLEPFTIPPLGRYYKEVWEEEEARSAPVPTVYLPNAPYSTTPLMTARAMADAHISNDTGRSLIISQMGKTPNFDPRQLKDDHLFSGSLDDVRSGPFTERLLASLLPTPPPSEPDGVAAQAGHASGSGGSGGLVLINGHGGGSAGLSQDMANYEERLLRELKAIDVIAPEETIDWSERTDDDISSTLRKVQKLLRKQIRTNELRKNRLFDIAMDRMAYQDYVACLTSVEREIEAGWLRRQTQIRKSMQAQKKKKGGGGGSSNSSHNNATGSASASSGGAPASGAAVVAAAALGESATSASHASASPAAAGTPLANGVGGVSSTAMQGQASNQGFIPENRGGGPIKPQFSEQLIGAMEKRRQLQFAFEPMFAEKPLARFTPRGDDSIYADLEAE